MAPSPLAEVREADASAEIRAIYADIKAATGIPQVNLIFRHLACDPIMLAWAWDIIGPLYRKGYISAATGKLDDALQGPACTPVWDGLPAEDARAVQDVLAFYNRGNPSNMIGLTTLLTAAEMTLPRRPHTAEDGSPQPVANSEQPAQTPLRPVPPLPQRDDMATETRALIEDLAALQGGAGMGVIPSLYLHLSPWHSVIAKIYPKIRPLIQDAAWPDRLGHLQNEVQKLAADLSGALDVAAPDPPAEMKQGYLDTVRGFATATIPEMVLIGRLLSGRGIPAISSVRGDGTKASFD